MQQAIRYRNRSKIRNINENKENSKNTQLETVSQKQLMELELELCDFKSLR
jgi:hypothetical protein